MEGLGLSEYVTRPEFERAMDLLRQDFRERAATLENSVTEKMQRLTSSVQRAARRRELDREAEAANIQAVRDTMARDMQALLQKLSEIAGRLDAMHESSKLRDTRVAELGDELRGVKQDVGLLTSASTSQMQGLRRLEATVMGDPERPDAPASLMKLLELMEQGQRERRNLVDAQMRRLEHITGENSRWIDGYERRRAQRRQMLSGLFGGARQIFEHRAALLLLGVGLVGAVFLLSPEFGEVLQAVLEAVLSR